MKHEQLEELLLQSLEHEKGPPEERKHVTTAIGAARAGQSRSQSR
jgi:hypothetical protein